MFVALAAAIAPWTIRNYGTTGHFVLVSSGTSDAFLRGMIFSRTEFITLQEPPYTDAENESNEYFQRLAGEAGTVWQRDDYETDQILNDEAKRVLREEPLQVARKTVVGLFTFWYQLTSLKNSLLVLACAIGAWALAIVGWRTGPPRAPARLAAAAPGLLPQHRARAAARARPVLGADPAGAARRLGVRRRHVADRGGGRGPDRTVTQRPVPRRRFPPTRPSAEQRSEYVRGDRAHRLRPGARASLAAA